MSKIYINNDYFYLDNKKIKCPYIKNGTITNKDDFILFYKKNVKNHHIIRKNLDVYLNQDILEKDIYYYKLIFEELDYFNISIKDTKEILEDNTLINNDTYYILLHNNIYYCINTFILETYLKKLKVKKLKIIGCELLHNNYCKYYYYQEGDNYVMKKILANLL